MKLKKEDRLTIWSGIGSDDTIKRHKKYGPMGEKVNYCDQVSSLIYSIPLNCTWDTCSVSEFPL